MAETRVEQFSSAYQKQQQDQIKWKTITNLDGIVSGEDLTLVPLLQGDVVVLVADRLQALVPLVLDPAGVWIVNVAVRRN